MIDPSKQLEATHGLLTALAELRHLPISARLHTVGQKHSMLHLDVLTLLYHLASHVGGRILEVGPYVGGSTIAVGYGLQDSGRAAPGRIVSVEGGGQFLDHPTLPSADILADLRKNLAKRGVAELVTLVSGFSGHAGTADQVRRALRPDGGSGEGGTSAPVTLFCLDADGGVDRDFKLYGDLLAPGCWVVIDDYYGPENFDKALRTKPLVDALVAAGSLTPLGLYGWGTWVGRWHWQP